MKDGTLTTYTSVFGDFESVWPPFRQPPGINHLLISDARRPRRGWEQNFVSPSSFTSSRLANRHQKMVFYKTLPGDGYSAYIDANVRPVQSLADLFDAFVASGKDMGMYRHYSRASVHEESKACIARGKVDDPQRMRDELTFYESEGFPDSDGMWEGSVIFKNHSSPRLGPAMNEWWDLYSRFQTRDQFSLPFVIWKHELSVFDLDSHSHGREHYFVRLQHSQAGVRNRMARYVQARAPENRFWEGAQALARRLSGDYGANE